MFTVYKKQIDWFGRQLTIETGKIGRQADASVMVTYGETIVMANVCFAKEASPHLDFFPLTVNYFEKFYAGGRIPGGFFKREGRQTEREILTCRLIDRPIRPLFHPDFKNETQVTCTVLQSDSENDSDIVSLIAASAALTLSGAPFMGPIGAARIGYKDGEYIVNPTFAEVEESDLNLVVAGTQEGVLMVESEAGELSEDVMLGAVTKGHEAFQPVIDGIIEVAEAAAKPGFEVESPEGVDKLFKDLEKAYGKEISKAYGIELKQERQSALNELKAEAVEKFGGEEGENAKLVKAQMKAVEASVLRGSLLKTKQRIDGRTTTEIRPIVTETDILPRTHGSALFTRGETQAIVVATLGGGRDEQLIDAMSGETKDRFMLHYNFPPYSVGETGRVGFTGRREIGHGWLARRAVSAMLPSKEDFPYTIRLVSEITESNGSSSMATVCGSSMAMMAAGVPLARPIAGIAMGLVKEGKDYAVLSDILGDEDHLGDMDFKVAGTEKGITALQMDIKITSITAAIMKEALAQAKDGRMHILGKMAEAIESPRGEISDYAPGMETIMLPKDKIRDVIGSGGKVIRELIEETGCDINIDDDGTCTLSAVNRAAIKDCRARIDEILAEPELNEVYEGKIVRVEDYGFFVRYLGKHEALVHISEMANARVGKVSDIGGEGDIVNVQVTNLNDRGRIRLTMKDVEQPKEIATRITAIEEGGSSDAGNDNGDDEKKGKGKGPRRRTA